MADFAGKKKLFLKIFCYAGSAGCVGLYWFDPNHLELSMTPFFMASIGFWGSIGFYNAYLPEIAPREEHDKLSARGYAMGYWSSLIILVICAILIEVVGKLWSKRPMTRLFCIVGLWWFGFAHVTFNALPELEKFLNMLFRFRVRGIARELRHKHLTRYLFAFFS